jgi:hypothetical protein
MSRAADVIRGSDDRHSTGDHVTGRSSRKVSSLHVRSCRRGETFTETRAIRRRAQTVVPDFRAVRGVFGFGAHEVNC